MSTGKILRSRLFTDVSEVQVVTYDGKETSEKRGEFGAFQVERKEIHSRHRFCPEKFRDRNMDKQVNTQRK